MEKGEYMKTTSIVTVARYKLNEMGEKGNALLLVAVIALLLAGLVIPAAAFSQSQRATGIIPAHYGTVQPPEMIPPRVVPHKIHVDVPTIGLNYTAQAEKSVNLSMDKKHPRHHGNGGSAASSAAAGGNGGSAASSAAAGGGGNGGGGSAASSAAAGGGGGSGGGSAASSAAAGGGGGSGSAASSAAAGG